jgi:hypothetical protein
LLLAAASLDLQANTPFGGLNQSSNHGDSCRSRPPMRWTYG